MFIEQRHMFVSILVPSEIAAANVGACKKKKKKRNFNPCSKINKLRGGELNGKRRIYLDQMCVCITEFILN